MGSTTRGGGFGKRNGRRIVLVGIVVALAGGLSAVGLSAPVASASSGYGVVATIPVGTQPNGIAVDPATGMVYVGNEGSNSVSAIDASTNTVTSTYTGILSPDAVAVDPTTDTVYTASDMSESSLGVIDVATGAVSSYAGGPNPTDVAVDPAAGLVFLPVPSSDYSSQFGDYLYPGAVEVVEEADPSTGYAIGYPAVPTSSGSLSGIAIDPSTQRIYVADEGTSDLSVLNEAANPANGEQENIATIPVGGSPWGVAVDEATDTIYVVDASSAALSVIDGATNTVTATIQLPYTTSADLEGGSAAPQGIAVDQATDTIYVSNWSASGGPGSVSVIDGATNTVEAVVPVGTTPDGIAVDQATGMAYVANFGSNTVSVIDASGGSTGSSPGIIDVSSGTLSFVSAPGNLAFPAVTLDGVDQSVSASLGIDLGDNTGLGAGWQLDATGTELSDASHSLPADAVSVDAKPTVGCDTGAECTPATDAVSYPYVLPTGTSPPVATALFSAAAGTGMGDQTVTPSFSLDVPANAAAGAYSATWTFSLVSGP